MNDTKLYAALRGLGCSDSNRLKAGNIAQIYA